MVETARFVRHGGGQAEVLLRVRQASNPSFAFLSPASRLHAYYRWVVEKDPEVRLLGKDGCKTRSGRIPREPPACLLRWVVEEDLKTRRGKGMEWEMGRFWAGERPSGGEGRLVGEFVWARERGGHLRCVQCE